MKNFSIFGSIINDESQRMTFEDLTPSQFSAFIKKLEPDEELEIQINSPGGDVYGGIAIANMIKKLNSEGHKTTAVINGLAASIASVIACACEKIVMNQSSFFMMHNCWTVVQGNSEELRREADTMDKINQAIVSFYKSKFAVDEEQIKTWMEKETWFSGMESREFSFNCEVIQDEQEFNIAAKLKTAAKNFKHMPKRIEDLMKDKEEIASNETIDEDSGVAAVEASQEPVTEEKKDEEEVATAEEKKDEVATEQKPEMISVKDADERVFGMQSAMAKQMNQMKAEYEAKIKDFVIQLEAKDKELTEVKDQVISLTDKLQTVDKELQATASALSEKNSALEMLNASVNTPAEELPDFNTGLKACKSPKEVLEFIKSGKYKKN